jgi:hypothetical protein
MPRDPRYTYVWIRIDREVERPFMPRDRMYGYLWALD